MNLFYEEYPVSVHVGGDMIPIRTDFRDYIQLFDILKSKDVVDLDKANYICSLFLKTPSDISTAIDRLIDFIDMKELEVPASGEEKEGVGIEDGEVGMEGGSVKTVYSFEYDYAYILSGFLQCYHINLKTVDYMHWWEFRNLFFGLPADTGIKRRIYYRGLDPRKIKDKEERERIQHIQNKIRLPREELSDYEIGNAFM